MAIPLLATKLHSPLPPPRAVIRSRLVEQLSAGLVYGRKLTLIAAPAGFGKSTLASVWIAGCGRPAAWLSLDENDGDPLRFLTYLVCALQRVAPGLGTDILEALQAAQPPPLDALLTGLLNAIAHAPGAFILVLDDYHLVAAEPVDAALAFLVEHLPPQLHVLITTRDDPALPLPRLRARNQLTEIRAADLRFTFAEAAEFLHQVMGLSLSADEVAALEQRTEGWIAGLQLAALSMQGNQNVADFIRVFSGAHRHIADYLVAEVLQRQPAPIRNFLLQTSILERMHGALCDAVTEQSGGAAQLEALQRGNYFLIPLDDTRTWYRYHHLFADVLRMRLNVEQPGQAAQLHRRASEWYGRQGLLADAIHHALAGKDFERAAVLIEQAAPALQRSRQEQVILGWLQALPDVVFHNRPVLSVAHALALLVSGETQGVEGRLRAAEQWLADTSAAPLRPDLIVVDAEEFRRLPGMIALARTGMAMAQGDIAGAAACAQQALELAPDDDHATRGGAAGFLGLVAWTHGDLETAHRTFSKGMAHFERDGNIADAIAGAIVLADIRCAQGRLHQAQHTYEHGLRLATAQHAFALRGAADMHAGLSELAVERNDLHAALWHLQRCRELGETNGFPQHPYRWRVVRARILQAQGDFEAALALLDEAEQVYAGDYSPNVRPVAALRARVWIAQGRWQAANAWVQARGLSTDDALSYLREFEHITLLRLLLARQPSDYPSQPATDFAARLLRAAEAGGRMRSVIELLLLQALTAQRHDDLPTALAALARAMTLAEPEGYIRIFVDEGAAMAMLLRRAAAGGVMSTFAEGLFAGFAAGLQATTAASPVIAHVAAPLIEPLSQRELEILRLFATELSGPEIARELVVALSTVRTHTKSIYGKLNVNNRRAAVRRAVELGLL